MPKRFQAARSTNAADLRAEFWRAPDEALLDRKTTAAGLGYTAGWLEWAATHGGGPVLTKIGRSVRYRKADVLAWLKAHSRRIHSTAELARHREA
ncbi:MAG: helix-turn-helix transcriptional regulator [Azonexus sp.]